MKKLTLLMILLFLLSSCIRYEDNGNKTKLYTMENKNDAYALQICIMAMNRREIEIKITNSLLSQEYIYQTCLSAINDYNAKYHVTKSKT